jgi:hypothetical protein
MSEWRFIPYCAITRCRRAHAPTAQRRARRQPQRSPQGAGTRRQRARRSGDGSRPRPNSESSRPKARTPPPDPWRMGMAGSTPPRPPRTSRAQVSCCARAQWEMRAASRQSAPALEHPHHHLDHHLRQAPRTPRPHRGSSDRHGLYDAVMTRPNSQSGRV